MSIGLIDFLSPGIELYIDSTKFTTRLGMLVSAILIMLMISSAIYFLSKFLAIDKPYVISSVIQQSSLTFKSIDKLPFAVRLTNEFGIPIARDQTFNIGHMFINTTKDENNLFVQSYEDLAVEPCILGKHIPIEDQNLLKDIKFESFYCTEWNPKNSYDLFNFYGGAEDYTFGGFYVNQCNTLSKRNTECKTKEELNALLTNAYIEILYLDFEVLSFQAVPLVKQFKIYRTTVSSLSYLRVWLAFQQGEYTSDSGLIFENKVSFEYYNTIVLKEQYKTLSQVDIDYGLVDFAIVSYQNYEKKEFFLRSYMKIQEAFANFGGIIKGLMVLAQVCYFVLNRKEYWTRLASMLPLSISHRINQEAVTSSSIIRTNNFVPQAQAQAQNLYLTLKKKHESENELSILESILPYQLYKTNRLKILQYKIEKLKEILSAKSIITSRVNIENLKLKLLSEDDAMQFDYIHSPVRNPDTNKIELSKSLDKSKRILLIGK